jgi:hypothetical protein
MISITISLLISLLIILLQVWSVPRKYAFNPPKIRFIFRIPVHLGFSIFFVHPSVSFRDGHKTRLQQGSSLEEAVLVLPPRTAGPGPACRRPSRQARHQPRTATILPASCVASRQISPHERTPVSPPLCSWQLKVPYLCPPIAELPVLECFVVGIEDSSPIHLIFPALGAPLRTIVASAQQFPPRCSSSYERSGS